MEEIEGENHQRRPLGMVLLGGLYLFFFMLTTSTFGHPFPFLGTIHHGRAAEVLVFVDSMICLYLFLGIMKRQRLIWYLLIGYNVFEVINTVINLWYITDAELEKMLGQAVDSRGIMVNNVSVIVAIILLTAFIYRHREYFDNRSKYLF